MEYLLENEFLQAVVASQGAGIERKCFEAALKEMAAAALQDPSTGTNPERCTQEEVIELFRKAYDGRGSRKEGYRYE